MFSYPGDVTGSIQTTKPAEKAAHGKGGGRAEKKPPPEPAPESKAAAGTAIALDQPQSASAGERALLERLQERRQELDARARELDLRESMLKAAEKKIEIQAAVEQGRGDQGRGRSAAADGPAQGGDRERPLQERRHHVRDHEAEGRRQDIRSARHQGADRRGEPDQAADACPRSWRRCRPRRPSGSLSSLPSQRQRPRAQSVEPAENRRPADRRLKQRRSGPCSRPIEPRGRGILIITKSVTRSPFSRSSVIRRRRPSFKPFRGGSILTIPSSLAPRSPDFALQAARFLQWQRARTGRCGAIECPKSEEQNVGAISHGSGAYYWLALMRGRISLAMRCRFGRSASLELAVDFIGIST